MAKDSNIVHQYFKKEIEGIKILVKVNPILFTGSEITIDTDGHAELRELEFDKDIFEDLKADEFEDASPLEFNLYLNGLV
ncbi:hypothetical protein [Ohtaekwangia koreensis]|jgi:hypothetical protein|uniref:Uncharacterized protein n=1 Tax=Ohtaekwangia koreensis TaxID=688867 RepID=A0A1T5MER1_9BACT|nr:hypothetical protein [Ohtaekwangia koreensis]SKC86731.1 hypothetical protein SAMN05660236_5237 [Ohtaekwangia koreensis]